MRMRYVFAALGLAGLCALALHFERRFFENARKHPACTSYTDDTADCAPDWRWTRG